MKTTELTEQQAVAELRKLYPRLRRTRSTAITHSGGRQTIFGCVCGSIHSASTDWNGRNAKHVRDWREAHSDCASKLIESGERPSF